MMFGKNDIQKNFKKQMREAEKELLEKEKYNDGAFINNYFKQRFYGLYSGSPKINFIHIIIISTVVIAIIFYAVIIRFFIDLLSRDSSELAWRMYECGEYERAIDYIDDKLGSNPNDYDALRCKGFSLNAIERFEEALKVLKAAEKIKMTMSLVQYT